MFTSMKRIAGITTLFGLLVTGNALAQEQPPAGMPRMEKFPPMCGVFQKSLRESPGFALLTQGSPYLTHNAGAFKGMVAAACPDMDWTEVVSLAGLTEENTKKLAAKTCNNIHGLAESGEAEEFDNFVHNVPGNHEAFIQTCGWAFGEGHGDGHQHNPAHHMQPRR